MELIALFIEISYNSGEVSQYMFIPQWNGIDDTIEIQNAIDDANIMLITLQPNKIYITSSLNPKPSTKIDLNGSTLKLKDNTQLPLVYDGGIAKSPKSYGFSIENGILDCNQANNKLVNQSSGCVWLTNWTNITIKNITIKNAFRNAINIWGSEYINIDNIKILNCGMDSGGFYSYGIALEPSCKYIKVANIYINNMYGFGLHFNQCEDFICENVVMDTLTHFQSIGITITQSKRGKLNNIKGTNIPWGMLEINASEEIILDNILSDNTGANNVPIITGDNGTTIFNTNLSFKNIIVKNTKSNYSLRLNYISNSIFENCIFDKKLDTSASISNFKNKFIDCAFNSILTPSLTFYDYFYHINTKCSDITIEKYDSATSEYVSKKIDLIKGTATKINISAFERFYNSPTVGTLYIKLYRKNYSAQGAYYKYNLFFYGTILNIIKDTNFIKGATNDILTVTTDTINKNIILTNNSADELIVTWKLSLL